MPSQLSLVDFEDSCSGYESENMTNSQTYPLDEFDSVEAVQAAQKLGASSDNEALD